FLGSPRTHHTTGAHESPPSMIAPMAVLAACCFLIGLAPAALAPILAGGVAAWAPDLGNAGPQLASLAPLEWITVMGVVLIAGIALAGAALRVQLHHGAVRRDGTWGCG